MVRKDSISTLSPVNQSIEQISVAVLLTCYNRRSKTLECLQALYNQDLLSAVNIHVYLVDDGSTDGTSDAVRQLYPTVHLLQGNGDLFWTGGMRLAFAEALQQGHDYYLWLNDDTILYPTALSTLLSTSNGLKEQGQSQTLIVGSTQDPETGELTYGGVTKRDWLRPCRFQWITPGELPKACDTVNGNCVLISQEVADVVGNLDTTFSHYGADFDYGLRAKHQGCSVWVAPGYVGTCPYNHPGDRVKTAGLKEQLQQLEQPKGIPTGDAILHPFWEWKVFTERYGGPLWPIYWLAPYRRVIWLSWLNQIKKLNLKGLS